MISKIIFVLATVCVINASVLTVNVFDDDPGTELASNPKDCNFRACNQLCRRLKFTGGACVNGRCKCDKFLNAEDGVSEKSLSNVENPVSQQDDPEAEVAASPSRCNLKVCDQVCRWLKKKSGSCVDGRCKCDSVLSAEGDMTDPTEFLSPSSCNFRACDQQCFRFGYASGTCVNGRCKCGNFLNAEGTQDTMTDSAESLPLSSCNSVACNDKCRRTGWHSGVCIKGQCKCDYFLYTEDTMTESAESLPLSSCNSIACDDQCRRSGWHSGVCIKGQCKCDYFLNTEVGENSFSNLEDSASLRKCTHQECNALCHKLKFREGVCIAGRCRCNNYFPTPKDTMNEFEESISLDDKFLGTEDEVSDESLPVSELSEDQTERGCNLRACDQLCRRLKFRGGACVNGRCKCDNFFGTEDAVDEYSEFAPRRICRLPKCNRTCTRRGYEFAKCVYGRCTCFNKTQAEDEISETSLPVSQLSEDQTERGCNLRACDQLCRRLKFRGGACVNGRCKCDIFFGTEDAVDEYSEFAPRRICRLPKCNRTCTRRGYEFAKCVYGRCTCFNKTQAEDEISETSLPVSELSEDQTERGCNTRACDQLCRRLKFRGGACVNGRCKCDIFFGADVNAVDEYSELATRRICNLRQCNRTCARRGYESARCVNGWCKCYNKIQRQEASPLNDVTSDENEESNVILRTNEEEPTVPSPRACNTVTCNQMCHRLNYAGGWCRFGQCQCY